ncbi:MAG: TRAP transporter small permease [Syntrophobacteraceae bacterium]
MELLVRTVTRLDDVVAKGEQWALMALVVVMSVVVFLQVFYRYLLAQPLQWSEELARYLFAWISLLGAALSVRKQGHFGVDYFFRKLPASGRRILTLLIYFSMGTVIVVLLFHGILLVLKTAAQRSPAMEISMGWAYACVPVGAAFMFIHLLSIMLRTTLGFADRHERETVIKNNG